MLVARSCACKKRSPKDSKIAKQRGRNTQVKKQDVKIKSQGVVPIASCWKEYLDPFTPYMLCSCLCSLLPAALAGTLAAARSGSAGGPVVRTPVAQDCVFVLFFSHVSLCLNKWRRKLLSSHACSPELCL